MEAALRPPAGECGNAPRPLNAFTVDVEDYFHVEAFARQVSRRRWERYPLRVAESTRRVLDLLEERGVRATFFILGWVAWKRPELVRSIADRGHEVGCHSFWHRLVYRLDAETFRRDTEEATAAIADACGVRPRAYRAPSFSVTPRSVWALDVLAELGYRTDSSVYPVRHDVYGFPAFPRHAVEVELPGGGTLVEVPMSTVRFLGANLPGPGGGYLRILPRRYALFALRRLNGREGVPAMVYVHPWEFDPAQPRIRGPLRSRFRHYRGLDSTARKTLELVRRFPFAALEDVLVRHPPGGRYRVETDRSS